MKYKVERWQENGEPDAMQMRKILEAEGYSVYQWQDAPGAFYLNHQHANDQTHWIISGALELTIENVGVFTIEPGDRDFMPAKTVHSARVVGDGEVAYLIGEKR
jgi:quercetin dioxygenase-like cupin family protein